MTTDLNSSEGSGLVTAKAREEKSVLIETESAGSPVVSEKIRRGVEEKELWVKRSEWESRKPRPVHSSTRFTLGGGCGCPEGTCNLCRGSRLNNTTWGEVWENTREILEQGPELVVLVL